MHSAGKKGAFLQYSLLSVAAAGEKLLPTEAEAFVSELRTFPVKHIGSDKSASADSSLES